MIAANGPDQRSSKLLVVDANGVMRHMMRTDLASLFSPGDAVIANDAATLPASLYGKHAPSGDDIEVRLAAWTDANDLTRFVAIAFGPGDYRIPTEERAASPILLPGDRLILGSLIGVVECLLDHPRLFVLQFQHDRKAVLAGLAKHGRPIQYAHVPSPLALWDVWTSLAAEPIAFEPPSAGFALNWRTLATWRKRGVEFATLSHAAGISSTGDAKLDRRLPFDEPYIIPKRTASIVNQAIANGRNVIAIGTTVVRALESAARSKGFLQTGNGFARDRIGYGSRLLIVDTIVTGIHQPDESHFELLHAFAGGSVLRRATDAASSQGYRSHEFGDSMLLERQSSISHSEILG